ncbi:hypothetical protein [Sporosarcina sp. FSL K6-1508]|uniref:hypothetical protein n=1 Tax=Sporosarcina sp. FSL K6-1508 TaxID=2921553 RepID=UPI0030FA80EB
MPEHNIELQDLLDAKYDYKPTEWFDKVDDPEKDRSHPGVKFTAKRGNNLETGADLAHDRINDVVDYLEDSDRTQKNLRFEFLLLKASVTSGLTSNIFVDNFETLDGIDLNAGAHDTELQRIYLP